MTIRSIPIRPADAPATGGQLYGEPRTEAPAPEAGPLLDTFDRVASDLRISVTDRCNFRCTYCMPAEGLNWVPRSEIMTFEEIARLLRVLRSLGVRSVKITGGEPTVRTDLPRLIAMLHEQDRDLEMSMTTNGYLLDKLAGPLKEAGMDRVTVSCDSLLRHRFAEMTARFARETGYEVRFIEYMPLDAEQSWERAKVMPSAAIVEAIDAVYPLLAAGGNGSQPATSFRFADGAPGGIGVIPSVTEPFCDSCDRLRLTAEGRFRVCLFSMDETDLLTPLRSGAADEEIERLIRTAVWGKWEGHKINHPDFERPDRSMSMIGG